MACGLVETLGGGGGGWSNECMACGLVETLWGLEQRLHVCVCVSSMAFAWGLCSPMMVNSV